MSQAIMQDNIFLLHAFLMGIGVTFVYDCIRIFRRIVSHNVFWISVEDLLFWFVCAIQVFLLMHEESDGELRWFAVLGALVGMFLYKKTISTPYVKYVSIVLGKVVDFLITKPMKWLSLRGIKIGGKISETHGRLWKFLKKKLTSGKKFIRMILCKH